MEMITDLVKNICAFMLLTTVINNLLQESVYRKYIRMYVGVVIILLVINPVLSIFSMDMDFENDVEKFMTSVRINEVYDKIYMSEEQAYEDILTGYEEILNEAMEDIAGKHGLYIVDCDWDFEKNHEAGLENDFGKINAVSISMAYENDVGYVMKDKIYNEIEREFDIEKENIYIEII